MTVDSLRQAHQASPFRPFSLCLADGQKVAVRHPEFLAQSPSGRTVIVYGHDDAFDVIDLRLVTRLEIGNGASQPHEQ